MTKEMTKEMQQADTSQLKEKTIETDSKPKDVFSSLLKSMKSEIANALPKHITPERMMRIAQSAYSRNLKLKECDAMTIIAGIMQASQMGLEIDTPLGHSYLIPFRNNKTGKMEAQFQTGYRGELALAYRTNEYKMIAAYCVYTNDTFEYELGMEQKLIHKPAMSPEGQPTFYYAIYKTISGGQGFEVMSTSQVDAHAKKFSMAYQKGWSSPWKSDFDAMAKKTVLKKLLSYAPKSIEYEKNFAQDGSVKRNIAKDMTEIQNEIDFDSLSDAGSVDKK